MLSSICRNRRFALALLLCTLPLLGQRGGQSASLAEPFHFRFMGPAVGNRISAAAGIAGDPSTYYVGAASGGVWKSTDGGVRWTPIFDDQPAQAIGALAIAPSDSKIIWAGTGEAWAIRDVDMMGDGIYKSTDAGKTWTNMGLKETGRIGRIVVHPSNPNIVFACALGRLTGPQQERGVYRSTDGGRNWTRVLFADANTGCSGLAMDPHNPDMLFAGMWQAEMHTYAMFSGGPGSGVYVSHDGGATWKRLEGHGLPHAPVGKIDVAIAPTNSRARLRADSDRRPGLALALRRRRRKLDRRKLGSVADRPRGLLHSRRRLTVQRGRSAGGQQQLPHFHRRRQNISRGPLGRRHARHLDRPGQRQSHPGDARRRNVHDHRSRQDFHDASRFRSGRCITSPSTATSLITSTETCRTMAPCAAPATSPEVRRTGHRLSERLPARDWHHSRSLGPQPGRLRIRLHYPRPHGYEYRMGHLLRRRSDALRCPHQDGAIRQPLAAHARLGAQQSEVPLSLDASAGRSTRSTTTPCITAAR